ncbi:MAG: TyrR/PhhR family helix-turn-helix DNA-binding protein [Pseudomonadota bacterium]|nr:TyrR/PhhR family helix-turn-helix DNA-binding protein [Pseudomonadota bacterium]
MIFRHCRRRSRGTWLFLPWPQLKNTKTTLCDIYHHNTGRKGTLNLSSRPALGKTAYSSYWRPPHIVASEFLTPILAVLNLLTRHYGVTVVLSTATQPALARQEYFSRERASPARRGARADAGRPAASTGRIHPADPAADRRSAVRMGGALPEFSSSRLLARRLRVSHTTIANKLVRPGR